MRLVTSLLLPMALAEPAPAVQQQVSECHDQLLEATKPDSTVDPCMDVSCWRNEFATKKTIIQKYKYINNPESNWAAYTKGIANPELVLFCPYQTSQTDENNSRQESMISLSKAPNCNYESVTDGSDLCIDRDHMFRWMVWSLTGYGPEKFYICLKPQVRQAYPDYDRTHSFEIKDVTPLSDYTYAAHKSNCEAKGGELNFNGWNDEKDSPSKHAFVAKMKAWQAGTETVFGASFVQYCFYAGMTQNSACQTACNSFHDRKSNGQLNYGVEKESHEMYCPVNAQQSGNTAAATLNILQDPNTNFFEYFMKSNYNQKNIVFSNRNAQPRATPSAATHAKIAYAILIAILTVIFI